MQAFLEVLGIYSVPRAGTHLVPGVDKVGRWEKSSSTLDGSLISFLKSKLQAPGVSLENWNWGQEDTELLPASPSARFRGSKQCHGPTVDQSLDRKGWRPESGWEAAGKKPQWKWVGVSSLQCQLERGHRWVERGTVTMVLSQSVLSALELVLLYFIN
jgi:hypothetical protein